ncbi:MAG: hypothetical protein ACR2OB_13965 [Solirubrobacteraceae bacterium]
MLAVTTAGGVVTWWANGIRSERARLQALHADAYAAVVSYQEFPFMIRRRRAPLPGHEEIANDERIRIADALQAVQEKLSNYTAQIKAESTEVSAKYDALVHETRLIAGSYMSEAWKAPPLDNDAGMNISDINYDALKQPQTDYLDAMKDNLRFRRVASVRLRT